MSANNSIALLVAGLTRAASFDAAAEQTLRALLRCADEQHEGLQATGALLRGVVHLRPHGSYQKLFGLAHGSDGRVEGAGYFTSANVWRWILEHRCSVSIDVQRGTIRPWLKDGPIERPDLDVAPSLPGEASRERMLGRDATHVHVVPLRLPAGEVLGVVTLEARNWLLRGGESRWDACQEQLSILASVAAPYLAALPATEVRVSGNDELLPVAGPTMSGMIELLRVFAQQEETILIQGPTGSGKSRLAQWCHARSTRGKHRMEHLDLLSVPEELQLAELFGWRRGAFTGAIKDTPGALSRAGEGTLFIDEIDKLALKAQAALLRVLEERRFRPLGDDGAEKRAQVRFIVGTNADLLSAVRAGKFREDLYYRINVLPVRLPPLADRLDELPLWAEYMLRRRHAEWSSGSARLAPDATGLLLRTPWPGNLRQLDNIVRRAYALAVAERGAASEELGIEARHVEKALAYDRADEPRALINLLFRAARAFVQEAEARAKSDARLSLEHCDVLRGLVLGAAVQRSCNREEAFVLLGQEQLLKNRNHHRALRRELERVREFVNKVGGELDPELAALLAEVDEPAFSASERPG
jgi:DNA-binding NtrC family response regulator